MRRCPGHGRSLRARRSYAVQTGGRAESHRPSGPLGRDPYAFRTDALDGESSSKLPGELMLTAGALIVLIAGFALAKTLRMRRVLQGGPWLVASRKQRGAGLGGTSCDGPSPDAVWAVSAFPGRPDATASSWQPHRGGLSSLTPAPRRGTVVVVIEAKPMEIVMSSFSASRREQQTVRLGWHEDHALTPAEQHALSRSTPLRPAAFRATGRTSETPRRLMVSRAR